jgi:hypothetical protein
MRGVFWAGISTAEEVGLAQPCFSDYHTGRTLAIFRHRLPQYEVERDGCARGRRRDLPGGSWWTGGAVERSKT